VVGFCEHGNKLVFQVLTAVVMKSSIFWDLQMEVTCSSETSVDIPRIAWLYVPENRTLRGNEPSISIKYG
jgi:hypothetical protein